MGQTGQERPVAPGTPGLYNPRTEGREAGRPRVPGTIRYQAVLTATGARTGQQYTTPLMYLKDGDRYLVFASKGGAPTNPAWYHNALANPTVTVEVETETIQARATEVQGAERDRLYAEQARRYPGFADYQAKTTRIIPVIALERVQ